MWWIIEMCLCLLMYTGGAAVYYNWGAATQHGADISRMATDTAIMWDQYANSLNSYVLTNINNPSGVPAKVTCQDLQNAGYLSVAFGNGNCTDPVGEQLVGYVASPWGFPQSWVVLAANGPDPGILARCGVLQSGGVPPSAASPTAPPPPGSWEAFVQDAANEAVLNERQEGYTGAVVQTASDALGRAMPNPGAFMIPGSAAGYNSGIDLYFPTDNVAYPQTVPDIQGYDGYAIMVAPSLETDSGYWLFNAEVILGNGTASITWTSAGYSPVCPNNGLTPGSPPADWTLDCNNGNGSVTPPHGICSTTDPSAGAVDISEYVCIPASRQIVDNYQTLPNSSPLYYNYQSYMQSFGAGASSSHYIGSDLTTARTALIPLTSQVIYIQIGTSVYTFVGYAGIDGCDTNSISWEPATVMMGLWSGTPPGGQSCSNFGVAPCFQPSFAFTQEGIAPPVWGLPPGLAANIGLE